MVLQQANRLLTDDYAASAEENLDRMANDMPEKAPLSV